MRSDNRSQKKHKSKDDIRWGHSLVPTGMMILLIVTASFGVTNHINHMEEEQCLERLYEEAGGLADTIELYSANDREELKMLSAVIAQYSDLTSPELWDLLDSYTNIGMMSRIELLLPGDVVLTSNGTSVDVRGLLSFEEEAAKGAHITDRESDIIDQNTYIARHYVPVERGGETIAMLYGVVVLGELPKGVNLNPYSGKGALYLIDGNTGDFLVDTWHAGTTGNIWALGERKMAPGYDPDQLKQGLTNGESRYVVFVSETAGEYLYFYYEPMAINNWRIAVSVPESVVFQSADTIRCILTLFLVFELVCFVVYFLWMMRYVRRVTDEKQKKFDALNHLYDIEQSLFSAHEKKEHVYTALEKLGSILSAGEVGFWLLGMERENQWYLWEEGRPAEERDGYDSEEWIAGLLAFFAAGNSIYESDDERELRRLFPATELSDISNAAAVPIEGAGGQICGILAAFNMKTGLAKTVLLKNMQFSFGRFCSNLKSYTEIQEQGDRDALTGLYNRNRYERDLPQIYAQHQDSLACVYIDANGLHETNNTKGHDKGDEMLRAVAKAIKKHFHTDYIYRTGGDEFVLFVPDGDEADMEMQSQQLSSALSEADYHISVGFQCDKHLSSITPLIQRAEQKMYAEKKKYYETHDRRREPRRLEGG